MTQISYQNQKKTTMNEPKEQEWSKIREDFESAMGKLAALEASAQSASQELAAVLKRFREHLNLSQEGAAKIMGVSKMYVSMLESGKRPWTARSVERLLRPILCL